VPFPPKKYGRVGAQRVDLAKCCLSAHLSRETAKYKLDIAFRVQGVNIIPVLGILIVEATLEEIGTDAPLFLQLEHLMQDVASLRVGLGHER